jgi:hypothetical protein
MGLRTTQGKSVFQTADLIAVAKLAQSFGDCRETERLRGDRYLLTIPQTKKLIGAVGGHQGKSPYARRN